MNNESRFTRRELLIAAAVTTPVAATGCAGTSRSNGEAQLRAEDPVARALAYYPSSADVPANHPLAASHEPSQKCATCIHVRGAAGEQTRECPVFPGRRVNADGWCSVWAQG